MKSYLEIYFCRIVFFSIYSINFLGSLNNGPLCKIYSKSAIWAKNMTEYLVELNICNIAIRHIV